MMVAMDEDLSAELVDGRCNRRFSTDGHGRAALVACLGSACVVGVAQACRTADPVRYSQSLASSYHDGGMMMSQTRFLIAASTCPGLAAR
jgi:hypothetical protein